MITCINVYPSCFPIYAMVYFTLRENYVYTIFDLLFLPNYIEKPVLFDTNI